MRRRPLPRVVLPRASSWAQAVDLAPPTALV